MVQHADVVVVGAGTAGCVLAARLTEDPTRRVVLVEAGPDTGPPEMAVPPAWPTLLGGPVDWSFLTTPQAGLGGRPVFYPRGKVVGGSSAINAMAHLRGHPEDYDAWSTYDAGWDHASLLPYFQRSESALDGDPAVRGVDGPMRISRSADPHPVGTAVLAAAEELGHGRTDDLNGVRPRGAGLLERNIVDGARQSAYDAYVAPVLDRPNLELVAGAVVTRVLLDGTTAVGIGLRQGDRVETVRATEVVLCAGAIASPHLLLLSGIGPRIDLADLGLDVVVDLPGVGRNLRDHPLTAVVHAADGLPPSAGNHADVAALLASSASTRPDLMVLAMDVPFHDPTVPGPAAGFSFGISAMRPHSVGSVRLASSDPLDPPLIDPAFLSDQRDLDAMVDAVELARELAASPAVAALGGLEVIPGPDVRSREEIADWLRSAVGTYFHPSGTCRFGDDREAVVDGELRVRGVSGLSVVDASVMPTTVTANTNATVLAVAERTADRMRA